MQAHKLESRVGEIADDVHPKPAAKGLDRFAYSCHTNAFEASCQLTNTGAQSATACVKGIVGTKNTSLTVESMVVCSGEVKPQDTKTLQAVFKVNAIQKLCPGNFGGVDWSECSFEIVDMTSAVEKVAKAP